MYPKEWPSRMEITRAVHDFISIEAEVLDQITGQPNTWDRSNWAISTVPVRSNSRKDEASPR